MKFIEPNFKEDERYPLNEFCDYFSTDSFSKYHHIEIGDKHVLLWCDLPNDIKFIEFFVVDEKFRNKGLGEKIIRAWMTKNNNPKIMADVDSERALKFWNKVGIRKIPDFHYIQPPLFNGFYQVDSTILSSNFEQTNKELYKNLNNWFKYGLGMENVDEKFLPSI